MELLIHGMVDSSEVNGPGRRAVVWLQGCSLGCPACWNPASHSRAAGFELSVDEVICWVRSVCSASGIAGLTFSGGEPLEQAPALAALIDGVRSECSALSIGLFSGYTEVELEAGTYLCFPSATVEAKRDLWQRIRQALDFAVLGRYNAQASCQGPLITSSNQRLRLYSRRYCADDFPEPAIEITIDSHGFTQITGLPVRGGVGR